ncbi:MAG: prepilin peptidase [Planctomycetes bacterium]|nr:prepilin peptidase [Planctomycetota bacterium]
MFESLPIPVAVVLVACVALAFIDLCKYKIYNIFTYPLLLAGLVYHGMTGGLPDLGDSLLGTLLGFGLLLPFYALGGMGGGDVKLMAAVGAWLGLPLTFVVFLVSSLLAGVYAVILVVSYGRVREVWLNLQVGWLRFRALSRQLGADDRLETEVQNPDRGRRVVPFAPMLALGLFVLLLGVRFLSRP